MGQQISRLCKYFRSKDSKVYQQQNSGSLSQHRSKILVQNNSDGYGSESEQPIHHVRQSKTIKWKKGELIGQGSFGRVFKCMDINSGRILAVKQIALGYVDKESLESFRQEIQILSQLKHKNIVEYYGCEEDDKNLSILLEFVGGGSIAQMMRKFKSKLSESIIQKYVTDILHGLFYLHHKGIIHRDIKGANIIVDTKGVCKLADFGCSIIGQSAYSLKGTPNWMAPEVQFKYRLEDTQTFGVQDVLSFVLFTIHNSQIQFNCTIIEMLQSSQHYFQFFRIPILQINHPNQLIVTNEPPWGKFQSPMQALLTISSKQCSPPIPNNISDQLKDFLNKCLQFDHKKRWQARKLLKHPFIINFNKKPSKGESNLSQFKVFEEKSDLNLFVAPHIDDARKDLEYLDKEQNPMIFSVQSSGFHDENHNF